MHRFGRCKLYFDRNWHFNHEWTTLTNSSTYYLIDFDCCATDTQCCWLNCREWGNSSYMIATNDHLGNFYSLCSLNLFLWFSLFINVSTPKSDDRISVNHHTREVFFTLERALCHGFVLKSSGGTWTKNLGVPN